MRLLFVALASLAVVNAQNTFQNFQFNLPDDLPVEDPSVLAQQEGVSTHHVKNELKPIKINKADSIAALPVVNAQPQQPLAPLPLPTLPPMPAAVTLPPHSPIPGLPTLPPFNLPTFTFPPHPTFAPHTFPPHTFATFTFPPHPAFTFPTPAPAAAAPGAQAPALPQIQIPVAGGDSVPQAADYDQPFEVPKETVQPTTAAAAAPAPATTPNPAPQQQQIQQQHLNQQQIQQQQYYQQQQQQYQQQLYAQQQQNQQQWAQQQQYNQQQQQQQLAQQQQQQQYNQQQPQQQFAQQQQQNQQQQQFRQQPYYTQQQGQQVQQGQQAAQGHQGPFQQPQPQYYTQQHQQPQYYTQQHQQQFVQPAPAQIPVQQQRPQVQQVQPVVHAVPNVVVPAVVNTHGPAPTIPPRPEVIKMEQVDRQGSQSPNRASMWFRENYDTSACRANLTSMALKFQNKFPSYLQKGGKDVALAGLVEQRLLECEKKSSAGHWEKVDSLLAKITLSKSEESDCRAGLIQERISCYNLLNYACQFIDKSYQFRFVPARITIQEARQAENGAEKCRKVVRLVKKRLQG